METREELKSDIKCPRCGSGRTVRIGRSYSDRQRRWCKDCKRSFYEDTSELGAS